MKRHMAVSVKGARLRTADPSTRHGVKALFEVKTVKAVREILDKAEADGLEVIPFDSCDDYDSTGKCNGHPSDPKPEEVPIPVPQEVPISELPMSLRTAASEEAYRLAKLQGKLKNLKDEEIVIAFKHWAIIRNNYPYDAAYKQCDMLIPKRLAATYDKLRWYERRELRTIIDTYCQANYHQVVENMAVRRSVMAIWHVHLLTFHDRREEFKL